ncbi:6261_t:CDS:2, partial [Cetraspora pellucida]
MGITLSSESQHINSTEQIKKPIRSIPDRISSELLKKNFSQIESYSLKTCFESICTVSKNGIAHIDEESFVKYLSFTDNIGVGPLIFRSFAYLANYPSVDHTPTLLTFNGLVKAIAIYCDKTENVIDEDYSKLLFESFATWEDDESCKEFLSLGKDTTITTSTITTIKFPKVKCQDLIDVLTAIVWVTTCEMTTANAESGNFMEILSNMISLKNISQIRDA